MNTQHLVLLISVVLSVYNTPDRFVNHFLAADVQDIETPIKNDQLFLEIANRS